MSAAELIARYNIEEPVAGFIMTDINSAIQHNKWAVEFRTDALSGSFGIYQYGRLTGEQYFRSYHGHARAIGWKISQIIDSIVRAEESTVAEIVSAGMARFVEPACPDETCEHCERPLWHHIDVNMDCRLCPMGRRFWQIARALAEVEKSPYGYGWKWTLCEIARRA